MKKYMVASATALSLALCLAGSLDPAHARASLTPSSALKQMGVINSDNTHIDCFSPDSKYLCAHSREPRDKKHNDIRHILYVFEINKDNSLGRLHTYEVKAPGIEQITFSPDSKAVVYSTKQGAKFVKVDIKSGEQTVIMDHVKGQPGFCLYPAVFTHNNGELLVQGYFYNEKDYCGENTISVLDCNKTGVEAFTEANEVDKMQHDIRGNYEMFSEVYPDKNVGYMGLSNDNSSWVMYRWIAGQGVKSFDKGEKLLGLWGGGERALYSLQRGPQNYDLIVYDGKADKKYVISEGKTTPYMYVFLSIDGKTALFNANDDSTSTTQMFYAREDENWQVKPIADIGRKIRTGTERISLDGTKVAVHSTQGLRIADIK